MDIIKKEEIMEILNRYAIGKKPLSLVLGWGEVTIIRYLEGTKPDQLHSDILYKIKDDEQEFLKYLEKNRKLITETAYKKAISRISELKLIEDQSKIYLTAKHIIAKMEDITPLALQKILYYIEGFSYALLDEKIFDQGSEAWIHGPVYREIYCRFQIYSYHPISENFQEYLELSGMKESEIELIDQVISCFGCYSGKILEKMSHLTEPWLQARKDLKEDEVSDHSISEKDMKKFFLTICEEYQIHSIQEIPKYSKKMFRKVVS